jgi:hypothetical protein
MGVQTCRPYQHVHAQALTKDHEDYGNVSTQAALHVSNLRTNIPQRRQTHRDGCAMFGGPIMLL